MPRRVALSDLPFWPRFLSRDEAARYVGVSPETFEVEVGAGIWPQPKLRGGKGGKRTWDRLALDARADDWSSAARPVQTAPVDEPVPPAGSPPHDPGAWLDAAQRRARIGVLKSGSTKGKRPQHRHAPAA